MAKRITCTVLTVALSIITVSSFAMHSRIYDSYKSGFYVGAEGASLIIRDESQYSGSVFTPQRDTDHLTSFEGGAFVGYGHILTDSIVPYFGAELGAVLKGKYDGGPNIELNNNRVATISDRWGIRLDILPGFFIDSRNTFLIYARGGISYEGFTLYANSNKSKQRILFRAGAGIEHRIVDNLFLRFQYVYTFAPRKVSFGINDPLTSGRYSSRPSFNAYTLGLSYRFSC